MITVHYESYCNCIILYSYHIIIYDIKKRIFSRVQYCSGLYHKSIIAIVNDSLIQYDAVSYTVQYCIKGDTLYSTGSYSLYWVNEHDVTSYSTESQRWKRYDTVHNKELNFNLKNLSLKLKAHLCLIPKQEKHLSKFDI